MKTIEEVYVHSCTYIKKKRLIGFVIKQGVTKDGVNYRIGHLGAIRKSHWGRLSTNQKVSLDESKDIFLGKAILFVFLSSINSILPVDANRRYVQTMTPVASTSCEFCSQGTPSIRSHMSFCHRDVAGVQEHRDWFHNVVLVRYSLLPLSLWNVSFSSTLLSRTRPYSAGGLAIGLNGSLNIAYRKQAELLNLIVVWETLCGNNLLKSPSKVR